jgi:hypothetical protein
MPEVRPGPFDPVFEALGLPFEVRELSSGAIRLPKPEYVTIHQPPDDPGDQWGHPPAFLPLWMEWGDGGPYYRGVWKHWFTDRRPITYGTFSHSEDEKADEIARDLDQLILRCLPSVVDYDKAFLDYANDRSSAEDEGSDPDEVEGPPSFLSDEDNAFLRHFGMSRDHPSLRTLKQCIQRDPSWWGRGYLFHPAFVGRPPQDLIWLERLNRDRREVFYMAASRSRRRR